tara:strand:+ start:189 stop:605 length:417 start_codon:yes stop_codon:yes gene_type:complete
VKFVLLALNEAVGGRRRSRDSDTRLVFVLVFLVVVRSDAIAQDCIEVGLDFIIVLVLVFGCLIAGRTGAFLVLVIIIVARLGVIIGNLALVELIIQLVIIEHCVVRWFAIQIVLSGIFVFDIAHQCLEKEFLGVAAGS